MKHTVIFLLIVMAFLQTLSAKPYGSPSLRSLVIDASVIIVGEPVGGVELGIMPKIFTVRQVLKGDASLIATTIDMEDRYNIRLTELIERDENHNPVKRDITKALLFLSDVKNADGKTSANLVGIRAVSSKGEVLQPRQIMNPGPLTLSPSKGVLVWDEIIARVSEDVPKIDQILAMENIADPAERNKVVLAWIESHKHEFGGGQWEGADKKGWAQIEWKVFDWVRATCIPDDAWRVTVLAVELDRSEGADYFHAFSSQRGRELLLEKVFDQALDEKFRLRALSELNDAIWGSYEYRDLGVCHASPEQQVQVIERVLPLLAHPNAAWRLEAARAVFSASWPPSAPDHHRIDKRAVPQFTERYKVERNADVREVLVNALLRLEDAAYWEKLTGNPEHLAIDLSFDRNNPEGMEFHARQLQYATINISEIPDFVFEKLSNTGAVVESQTSRALAVYPEDLFIKGWSRGGGVSLRAQPSELSPGIWRVKLRGTVNGKSWHSEPVEIAWPR
jgi:hypothetical protein